MRRLAIIAVVLLTGMFSVNAQSGGQFCVRAFEDANANQRLDAGENLLTHGLSVNLLDASNVTIASALLDQSPTAAQGVVCFQFLPAGQYTMSISSAEYKATTPTSMTTTVIDSGQPTVMEFGAQVIDLGPTAAPANSTATALNDEQAQIVRVLVAALATLVVVIGMLVLGLIVYMMTLGRRRPVSEDTRRTTGSMQAVKSDTGRIPKV
ncbi:MAG: hypothetical protein R3E39_12480 [Anaerolineae bacterium]